MAGTSQPFGGSLADFDKLLAANPRALFVVHFWAGWAPQCAVVEGAIGDLTKQVNNADVRFVTVEAETAAEVSLKYNIEAVPTVIFLLSGREVDRVNGANIPDIASKTRRLLAHPPPSPAAAAPVPAEPLEERLKRLVNQSRVVLFMKGNADTPRCGFSRQAIEILKAKGVVFTTFDILEDEEVRQGLKKFSNWQTYPQLYVNGQLVGGVDVLRDLDEAGELDAALVVPAVASEPLEERLKRLVNQSRVVLFMKGNADAPRCGFSRQAIDILKAKGVEFTTFDILEDEDVRQGLKKFSNWQTYPQLYVKGQLIGGVDVLRDLDEAGELDAALNPA